MKRIIIIGSSGSGKTTIGKQIAKELSVSFIELDKVVFKDDAFVKPPVEVYRENIKEAIADNEHWVAEGVFPKIADIVWAKADILVWIDIPFKDIRERHDERAKKTGKGPAFESSFKHEREHKRLQGVYADLIKEHRIKNVLHITSVDQDIVKLVKDLA